MARDTIDYGIDLGTTNSLVAYIGPKGPEVIRDESGNPLVPSIVYFDPVEKRLLVGEEARDRLVTEPRKAIYSVKRFMGKGIADVGSRAVNPGAAAGV